MLDHAPTTTAITDKLPSPTWQRWFRAVSDWIRRSETIKPWDPVVIGGLGTATTEARYVRVGSVVYFSLSITPSGAWSATQGVTSVGLPVQATVDGGIVVAQSGIVQGIATASGTSLSLPTLSTSSPLLISGAYIAGGE
jgi:hypothetical protein